VDGRHATELELFEPWWDQVRDLEDKVLALGGVCFRARRSGVELEDPMGWVFELREGRVAGIRFPDRPIEALSAVGLRE
jgi:ketosteroid isomerase-like protein